MESTDSEAETPTLWPPDAKNWLIWKDPNTGKHWRREEKRTTEDEMVGWHHQLYRHRFEQSLGVVDGQESLACCSPRGRKESDTTEWLNWTDLSRTFPRAQGLWWGGVVCTLTLVYSTKYGIEEHSALLFRCFQFSFFHLSSHTASEFSQCVEGKHGYMLEVLKVSVFIFPAL